MSRLYLGIDGGQTGTTALIANEEGVVIGTGRGGPCNHVSTDEARAKFLNALWECLQQACRNAGIDAQRTEFAAACFGLSGGASDKEAYARELVRSRKYKFTHDAEIALLGATEGLPGVVVIAGTGSFAFGRNAAGKTMRAGGWGYVFGDEGGGFDIARQALRSALRFEEGWGPATGLRKVLLDATGAQNANDALHLFYTPEYPRAKVAQLAALVDSAASDGDDIASKILEKSARRLAQLASAIYASLFAHGDPVPVAYTGGVFQSRILLEAFSKAVNKVTGGSVARPRLGSAAGAVLEAMRLDNNFSSLTRVPESEK